MSKRLERELKSVDTRMLYKPKRKQSTEPVLLGAIRTTELNEPATMEQQQQTSPEIATTPNDGSSPSSPSSTAANPPSATTDSSTMIVSSDPLAGTTSVAIGGAPPNSPNDGNDSAKQDEPSFPRFSPLSIPPSLLSNQDDKQKSASTGLEGTNANGPSDGAVGGGETGGNSVIVNLSPKGSKIENKKRLSRILDEVQRKRKERREREHSFGTDDTSEKMERDKEKVLRRLDKLKRSEKMVFKYQLYEFLKRPSSFWSTIYHVIAFVLVMTCLIVSMFPQMDQQLEEWGGKWIILDILEKLVIIWFSVEYLLRLWSCNCRPKYKGVVGKWNFIKAPAHLIDLFVIVLSVWVMVWPHEGHEVFAFRAFRGFHRFFQVVQIIITERQLQPWRLFLSVLYDQREQLMVIFYLEIILFALLAYLGFLVEHQSNDMLDNMADAVWWSVVTLTTVGYGDKVPISWRGKIISGFFILFGFCVFALPAGIIGAGLALKLEQVEQQRQRRKKVDSAARVIQRAWHCHHDFQACYQLSAFFSHQPGDLYKARVLETISQAFISVVQFHVAKTEFKKITRGVDLRNVIESYKYGQMDIFARLKQLNTSLDLVMTRLAKQEQERTEAIKRLTEQLMPDGQGDADTLIRTRDGSYLINTVSGCFSSKPDDSMLNYPDLQYIPNDKDQLSEGGRESMRIRSLGGNQMEKSNLALPFIDSDGGQTSNNGQLHFRKSGK